MDNLKYFKGDELAAKVFQDKYSLNHTESPDEMFKRMTKEFELVDSLHRNKESLLKDENHSSLKDLSLYGSQRRDLSEESIYGLIKDFKYLVPQGSIMSTLGTNILASLSNCWVSEPPFDSYPGIIKTDGDLVSYYTRRGGVGVDISTLRPKGTKTRNTAKVSTGATSFMERYSNTTREVAMEGRRK